MAVKLICNQKGNDFSRNEYTKTNSSLETQKQHICTIFSKLAVKVLKTV